MGTWESDVVKRAENLYAVKLHRSDLPDSDSHSFLLSLNELVGLFAAVGLALDGTPYMRLPAA